MFYLYRISARQIDASGLGTQCQGQELITYHAAESTAEDRSLRVSLGLQRYFTARLFEILHVESRPYL